MEQYPSVDWARIIQQEVSRHNPILNRNRCKFAVLLTDFSNDASLFKLCWTNIEYFIVIFLVRKQGKSGWHDDILTPYTISVSEGSNSAIQA